MRCKTRMRLMGLVIICKSKAIFQKPEVLDFWNYFFPIQQRQNWKRWCNNFVPRLCAVNWTKCLYFKIYVQILITCWNNHIVCNIIKPIHKPQPYFWKISHILTCLQFQHVTVPMKNQTTSHSELCESNELIVFFGQIQIQLCMNFIYMKPNVYNSSSFLHLHNLVWDKHVISSYTTARRASHGSSTNHSYCEIPIIICNLVKFLVLIDIDNDII